MLSTIAILLSYLILGTPAALIGLPWTLLRNDISSLYRWAMWIANAGLKIGGIRIDVTGREQLDPQQRYIYMADGVNEKVKIVDRQTLQELTTFGDGGRQPGQFYGVHSIATDSKGNVYTTETYEGKRLQRFLLKGMAPVTTMNQGALAVWPTSR